VDHEAANAGPDGAFACNVSFDAPPPRQLLGSGCARLNQHKLACLLIRVSLFSQVLSPDHIGAAPAAARHPSNPTNASDARDAAGSSSAHDEIGLASDHDHHDAMIRVPVPGIRQYKSRSAAESSANDEDGVAQPSWRDASGTCAICLGHYVAGDVVAWSSNALCEHCFHLECIEAWLHKQRTFALGALCPVCRRDFLVDPCFVDGEDNCSSLSCGVVVATSEGGGVSLPPPPPLLPPTPGADS
jgi:Ring finger domain